MRFRAVALVVVLVAPVAFGASGVEALRTNAAGLRERVSQLRGEQLERRNELSVVSSRIESLKAQSKGALLPGSELDQALRRSQELSAVLTQLAQQLSAREGELEAAQMALVEVLSEDLRRLRADFDRQTDRGVRKDLIAQMRRLRSERDALRAALPTARLPTLDALKPSDDPEQLLEQVDLLRENEEKVLKELKALDSRIAQRREEAELDRRVQRFLGEESMFDDPDRRLRVQRKEQFGGSALGAADVRASAAPGNLGGPMAPSAGAADSLGVKSESSPPPTFTAGSAPPSASSGFSLFGSAASAPPQTANTRESGFGAPQSESAGGNIGRGSLDTRGVAITSSSDARPQVGASSRGISGGDEEALDDLNLQRRKLERLAEELKRKALELEKRATQLR
jgi:hypothetical protein